MVANHEFKIIFEKFDLGFKYFLAFSLRVGIILSIFGLEFVYCLLFTILRLFGTKESIRGKVDHGGQIVL